METQQKIRFGDFMVHFDTSWWTIKFEVYQVSDWQGCGEKEGQSGVCYYGSDNGESIDIHDFSKDTCEELFNGSYCWRGVWEGRLYFELKEYWGEQLSEMSELYSKKIEPWCKEFIRNRATPEDAKCMTD